MRVTCFSTAVSVITNDSAMPRLDLPLPGVRLIELLGVGPTLVYAVVTRPDVEPLSMQPFLRAVTYAVKPPRALQELALRVMRVRNQLWTAQGREPTVADLAAALGSPLEAIVDAVTAAEGQHALSLDDSRARAVLRMRFEFDLRRKAGTDSQQLFLSGADEVPAGFRQAIEEYYRALAKKNPR